MVFSNHALRIDVIMLRNDFIVLPLNDFLVHVDPSCPIEERKFLRSLSDSVSSLARRKAGSRYSQNSEPLSTNGITRPTLPPAHFANGQNNTHVM